MRTVLFANRVVDPVRSMTGIGRYVKEITIALTPRTETLVLSAPHEEGRPAWLPGTVSYRPLPGPRKVLHSAWMALHAPRLERLIGDIDLLHALHPSFPIPTAAPAVVTVHDLMPLNHPEWYQKDETWGFRASLDRIARGGWHVIADSQYVAAQIESLETVDPARIHVVHLAVGSQFRETLLASQISAVSERYGVQPGKYVLAVGNVATRKNLEVLIRAFGGADRRGSKLLFAGRPDSSTSVVHREIEASGLADDIVLGGFVPDVDLPALLQGATLLAHPSVDEGFGIPPLEAMACGTPVIGANAGSLPEIIGNAGVLVDPHDVKQWRSAIELVTNDDQKREALATAGRRRAEGFTWPDAARQTAAVYRQMLSCP